MTWYLVQPKDWMSIYGFLIFAKNIRKNISENLGKNSSGKYIQRLFDHIKQYPADALKRTSKRVIQKKSRSNWWFIW